MTSDLVVNSVQVWGWTSGGLLGLWYSNGYLQKLRGWDKESVDRNNDGWCATGGLPICDYGVALVSVPAGSPCLSYSSVFFLACLASNSFSLSWPAYIILTGVMGPSSLYECSSSRGMAGELGYIPSELPPACQTYRMPAPHHFQGGRSQPKMGAPA